jgi:hypothetical protein
MTQSTPNIGASQSGLQYRTADNDGKKALLNHHKGSTAPTYAEAGIVWLDDSATPWKLKAHDGADWITLGEIHATNNTFKPYNGTAQTVIDLTEASIASAATCDLGTMAGNMGLISGTTTITSLGSTASTSRPIFIVRFSGALTLTYNATSLILPTAANITTVNGDSAVFEYLGSGNWKCLAYSRFSGAPLTLGTEGTIASATTTDLGTIGVNILSITGTTTITSLGSTAVASNPLYFVRFTGALTLTHNAASLILPGAANITTVAGDTAVLKYEGSGNWRCQKYSRISGAPLTLGVEGSIASAATTDLGTISVNILSITGTTTITGLGSTAVTSNPLYFVRFTGALTLTHNATSLILPGAANILTVAGDTAIFKYEGSGNWRCMQYTCASGLSPAPGIPQNSKSAAYTTVMGDAGKHILHPSADTTARTFTIDSNANVPYPIGTALTFVNQNAGGVITIAITTDTMRLAGAGTTGSRTLAANGVATALKLTSTEWIISGTGLT